MNCQIQQQFQQQTDIIMSKSMKTALGTYASNIKQASHQRRASHLPESSSSNLNKETNMGKKVGMIIRNPSREMKKSNQKENIPVFACQDKNWIHDQILMKVKHSQLANKLTINHQPQQQKAQIVPKQSKTVNKLPKRNTRSVSNHYQERYNLLVEDYQKKKQKISHEIEKVRHHKTYKNALFFEFDQNTLQTPKFGSGFKQEIIKKLSVNIVEQKTIDFSAFINAIKKQMELDEALRLAKHMVTKDNEVKINEILKKQYNLQENLTFIQADEFDPFAQIQAKSSQCLASDLFKNHIAAEQYWNKHIVHNFQEHLLASLFNKLKTRSQNAINLKDFVREIGLLTHNQRYLRNRDLFRIFKRLQPLSKENFLEILKSIK